MAYADDAMHKVLEVSMPEHQKIRWLRARDERTRAEMVYLINEDWPGGEALDAAVKKHAHFWDMEDKPVAANTVTTLAGLRDAQRQGSPSPARSSQRGTKRPAAARAEKWAYRECAWRTWIPRSAGSVARSTAPRAAGTPARATRGTHAASKLQTDLLAKAGLAGLIMRLGNARMSLDRDSALSKVFRREGPK